MKLTDGQRQRITKAMDSVDIGKCDYLKMLAAGMRELAEQIAARAKQRQSGKFHWLEMAGHADAIRSYADDLEAK